MLLCSGSEEAGFRRKDRVRQSCRVWHNIGDNSRLGATINPLLPPIGGRVGRRPFLRIVYNTRMFAMKIQSELEDIRRLGRWMLAVAVRISSDLLRDSE